VVYNRQPCGTFRIISLLSFVLAFPAILGEGGELYKFFIIIIQTPLGFIGRGIFINVIL